MIEVKKLVATFWFLISARFLPDIIRIFSRDVKTDRQKRRSLVASSPINLFWKKGNLQPPNHGYEKIDLIIFLLTFRYFHAYVTG